MKEEVFKGTNLVIKFWITTLEYHVMLECNFMSNAAYYKRAEMFVLIGGEEDDDSLRQAI